jgi:para-nitrobenzyl esterase
MAGHWQALLALLLPFVGAERAGTLPNQTILAVPGLGTLLGNRLPSNVSEFLGIPFATPPLGPLRFLPPEPLARPAWADLRNATAYSKSCPQAVGYVPALNATNYSLSPRSSEDCFYLNVWVPPKAPALAERKLPVFFWIYGGGRVER